MVSGKPSKIKSFKSGKNVNYILVLLCLTLVFLGKLDLIAVRNIKAFLSDFLAPVTYALNKPVKEIAGVFEDVKSAGSLREENIRLKSEVRKLRVINSKASSQELELLELRELPSLSYAVPPTNLSEISKDKDLVFSIQSMIFNTSAITSLPIPSPGKIKIFLLLIFDYTIQGWILCIFSS